jgi:hypothetical protein
MTAFDCAASLRYKWSGTPERRSRVSIILPPLPLVASPPKSIASVAAVAMLTGARKTWCRRCSQ